MYGPCAKQVVTATIVALDGQRFVGTNGCCNPQEFCPRGDAPTGIGYEKCVDVCQQTGHAEINALKAAGDAARGATLWLEGHTYACQDCWKATRAAGLLRIMYAPPPAAVVG